MTYLAIDPGEERIGYAEFDDDGNVTNFLIINGYNDFLSWLESRNEPDKLWIVESYRARPGVTQNIWSRLPTVQMIGAIKWIAFKKGIHVVEQDPSPCLPIGLKFAGFSTQFNGKHVPDHISALAHGTYYLRKAGINKP